jgi:hypothetical protein
MREAERAFRAALSAGTTIGCGSDVGVFRHGDNYREPAWMVRLGMSAQQALRACTSVAARILRQEQRIGRIAPGLRADLAAFEGDPSVRIDDLRHPVLVMKDGRSIRPASAPASAARARPPRPVQSGKIAVFPDPDIPMQLDTVRAVVTGGVSGLGFAVAQHLVAQGARSRCSTSTTTRAPPRRRARRGQRALLQTDVTDEAGVVANVAAAKAFLGGLNAAINCAGILGAGRVLGKEGADAAVAVPVTVMVNLVGSFNVAKAAAALMQNNEAGVDGERGVIVNTASVAAYEGQIGQAAYSAARAAWSA